MKQLKKRLKISVIALLLVVSFGTAGYMALEGWTFLDSLYMTVITLATVGYREIHVLSDPGIVFTIILIIVGTGTALAVLGTGATIILEGELQEVFGRRRLERRIRDLHDHYVVCGFGRMGKIISRELRAGGKKFVVIEKDPSMLEQHDNMLAVIGDATRDPVLKEAGIERAKGLISVLSTDAENLFVVLSARGLNRDLFIVARAVDEGSENKLVRAGADKVISPYHIGGIRMAYTVLKPAVVEFIEFATKTGNIELQLEEVVIGKSSRLVGETLDQSGIGKNLGIIIVGIKRANGELKFNPTSKSVIHAGDTLITIGEAARQRELEELAAG